MRRKKVRKRLEIIWKLFPYNYMEIISEQIFHTSKEVERKERMWSSKELNSIIAFLPRVSYYEKWMQKMEKVVLKNLQQSSQRHKNTLKHKQAIPLNKRRFKKSQHYCSIYVGMESLYRCHKLFIWRKSFWKFGGIDKIDKNQFLSD